MEGKKNPADCASRGLSVESFLTTEIWIRGPDFIWKLEDHGQNALLPLVKS